MFFQEFTVAKFNYFISNIELKQKDGTYIPMLQDSSYFLIKEKDPASLIANLNWVNEGEYTGIRFVIGVDSVRNTMPISQRTGVLDISGYASDMYWTWNSGYIFMRLEGTFNDPNDTVADNQFYQFHIGGYGPTINNIKTTEVSFNTSRANVRQAKGIDCPEVHIYTDASKVISGNTDVDFTVNSFVMFAPYSTTIANNYKDMFRLAHIHDD